MLEKDMTILKDKANSCRKTGKFLLSTARMSDFWIDINEFNTRMVVDSLIEVSSHFITQYYANQGNFSLAIPKYNNSSEKSFPIDYILESAIEISGLTNEINKVYVSQTEDNGVFFADGERCDLPCVVSIAV